MAALSTTIAAIAAVTSVASAYTQYEAGKDAADAQKKQERISRNQAKIEQDANRRQQIREERVRRGQIEQASQNTGVASSSGESGSLGALSTITAGNIASSFQADRTSDRLFSLSQDVAGAQSRAATAGAVGQLAGAAYNMSGGATSIFDAFTGTSGVSGSVNNQGQSAPLLNNKAFVSNY